jgi:hypothetical protein
MFTREGFCDLFWERLAEARKKDPMITQEEVFDLLNAKWREVMGVCRFASYDTFRRRQKKK